jgi:2-dehydropantoate 2-reductase
MRPEPGVVECTGVGEVVLGPRDGGESPTAERVFAAFDAAGVVTELATDMPHRLWEKLAVNAGINPVTALARVENGALVDGPANDLAVEAAREVAAVARAGGIDLTDDEATAAVERVAAATAANTSSMHQDVLAGRRTEVDAISGYVVDRADRPVPATATMTRLLRAWERARGLR